MEHLCQDFYREAASLIPDWPSCPRGLQGPAIRFQKLQRSAGPRGTLSRTSNGRRLRSCVGSWRGAGSLKTSGIVALGCGMEIGRAHAELQSLRHLVCRLLLEKNTN